MINSSLSTREVFFSSWQPPFCLAPKNQTERPSGKDFSIEMMGGGLKMGKISDDRTTPPPIQKVGKSVVYIQLYRSIPKISAFPRQIDTRRPRHQKSLRFHIQDPLLLLVTRPEKKSASRPNYDPAAHMQGFSPFFRCTVVTSVFRVGVTASVNMSPFGSL